MLFHGIYELCETPRVIALYGDDAMDHVAKTYKREDGPLFFLWHCAWYQGRLKSMLKLKYKFWKLKRLGITPVVITNTDEEERFRKLLGIPGFKCLTYIFTNENQYSIGDGEKRFDAIYTAQMLPFKRLELAKMIKRLYILTYKPGSKTYDLHEEYPMLTHADYNRSWVGPEEKDQLIQSSHVGLCLSAEEGAMLASLEYQLSGLPVVSTPSKGGRDGYYDSYNSRIVNPSPSDVIEAVEDLMKKKVDPEKIRNEAISKMVSDRKRYVDFTINLVKKHTGKELDPNTLMQSFFSAPEKNFVRF